MGLLDRLFGGGKKAERASGVTLTHRVGVNETCRSLAKKYYGDEAQWEKIYKPNEWRLKDEVQSGSDTLLPGTELTIKDPKFDAEGQPVAAA
jgi:nucleoid-associated protein YgaU